MKRYKLLNIIAVLLLVSALSARAQEERNQGIIWSYLYGWECRIKTGFDIRGTSPLPLPEEVRRVDSYAPGGLAISIEGNATKWFDTKWGITAEVRFENKNMTTEATVKNYGIKVINTNGGELQGLWIGGVKTKVRNSCLAISVVVSYKVSKRWKISAGPYVSYLIERNSFGHAYEGHLRTPDQTGSRVDLTGESIATYDFSDNLYKFQWGLQSGGEWRASKHLNVYADSTWGSNDIFKKDFDTISFAMYLTYLNIGFGHTFWQKTIFTLTSLQLLKKARN